MTTNKVLADGICMYKDCMRKARKSSRYCSIEHNLGKPLKRKKTTDTGTSISI